MWRMSTSDLEHFNPEILTAKSLSAHLVTSSHWNTLFRTAWKPWAPTSIRSASSVPTVGKYLPTPHSTWRTAFPTAKKVQWMICIALHNVAFLFRLEWAVYHEVYILWLPNRGWGSLGGGSQQQLSLTMFQLQCKYQATIILSWPSTLTSPSAV